MGHPCLHGQPVDQVELYWSGGYLWRSVDPLMILAACTQCEQSVDPVGST